MLENGLHKNLPRRGTIILGVVLALMLLVNTAFSSTVAAAEDEERGVKDDSTTSVASGGFVVYMPFVARSVPEVTLAATRASSTNQWTVSWDAGPSSTTGYVLQESHDPDFSIVNNEFNLGLVTSRDFTYPISFENEYYYRVRVVVNSFSSGWSNVGLVAGGYRDDFNDPNSGWDLRRTSFLEKTVEYYGSGSEAGNYIIIVDDRWDWMIASPMKRAPEVPYVLEYRAKVHDPSNLVSGGMAFGGDWNGASCPDNNSIYEFDSCFNSFYNLNFIFFGPIKLLFERIDELVWCPTCGGSLLKRIGYTEDVGNVITNSNSRDYHDYRVEVRDTGIQVFVNNNLEITYNDTRYINQPYFGVFASTEEYKPSIWFFDYVQVLPLD